MIKEGANTFLRREYKVLAKFAAVAAIVIFVLLPSPIWQGHIIDEPVHGQSAYIAGNGTFRHRRQNRHHGGHAFRTPAHGGRRSERACKLPF